jgi:hypothetical protein
MVSKDSLEGYMRKKTQKKPQTSLSLMHAK